MSNFKVNNIENNLFRIPIIQFKHIISKVGGLDLLWSCLDLESQSLHF